MAVPVFSKIGTKLFVSSVMSVHSVSSVHGCYLSYVRLIPSCLCLQYCLSIHSLRPIAVPVFGKIGTKLFVSSVMSVHSVSSVHGCSCLRQDWYQAVCVFSNVCRFSLFHPWLYLSSVRLVPSCLSLPSMAVHVLCKICTKLFVSSVMSVHSLRSMAVCVFSNVFSNVCPFPSVRSCTMAVCVFSNVCPCPDPPWLFVSSVMSVPWLFVSSVMSVPWLFSLQ